MASLKLEERTLYPEVEPSGRTGTSPAPQLKKQEEIVSTAEGFSENAEDNLIKKVVRQRC